MQADYNLTLTIDRKLKCSTKKKRSGVWPLKTWMDGHDHGPSTQTYHRPLPIHAHTKDIYINKNHNNKIHLKVRGPDWLQGPGYMPTLPIW